VAEGSGTLSRDDAEARLVRKLRTRQLSERESRTALRDLDVDASVIDEVIEAFVARGYLNDARLAEQVVHAAIERKGQGRHAIVLALTQRGIPRDVTDAALAELPDDEHERALAFAESRARSMRSLDPDTALRRLSGQLQRRGYPAGVAFSAAKDALSRA